MSDTNWITSFTPNNPRNDHGGWLGHKFTVGSSSISVVALGRAVLSGNTQAHTVRIVRASDSTVVTSASVATSGGTAGTFARTNITPVTLAANTDFYVVSEETNGGDRWNDSQCALQVTAVATPVLAAYSFAATPLTFKEGGVAYVGDAYVPTTFWYATAPPPGDTTPPALAPPLTVEGNELTIPYNEALHPNFLPLPRQYTVRATRAGSPRTIGVQSVAIVDTTKVRLTLAEPVLGSDSNVRCTYVTSIPLRDLAGNLAGGFTDQAVTAA